MLITLILLVVVVLASALFVLTALRSPDLPEQRSGLDDRAVQESAQVVPAEWSERVPA